MMKSSLGTKQKNIYRKVTNCN